MPSRAEVERVGDATTMVAAWSLRARQPMLRLVPTLPPEQRYRRLLGKAIVQLRALRGISQARFSEDVGRSEAAVSRWENGKATPTAWDLREIARVLDCPADLLLDPPELPVSPVAEEIARRVEAGASRGLRPVGPTEADGRVA